MYLLGNKVCFLGLTKIGNTITPTVKTQMGATTKNIDSKDINCFQSNIYIAVTFLKVMRIYF